MDAQAVLDQARQLGIELRADGDGIRYRPRSAAPEAFVEALRQHKGGVRRLLIIEGAYRLADKVQDAQGITDPLVRQINRLSWAVLDLQDAGEPEAVWKPLQEKYRQMERSLGAQRRGEPCGRGGHNEDGL